ncbi:hypothetical protein J4U02_gp094 [Mycobacterium phage Aziz]|uniref:Uncharacterized protein n=1 Tax=Mycobacterium phage Aziz TaxID=2762281 RepID=A0A7G8LHN2_9CAUD|nr:hypothetical protein J4U02_gp094 [Mycobacterium phage Aziz]ASR75942.1 hypothetical protein SEA_GENEVAB15_96 [Mycobacterium phage GenevaB15]QNJ56754.1 hypothetical protein SEA_AZIZ_94 [Mycobacterium phage Aziz]
MSDNYLMIHGASDDLIEVSGRVTEEFDCPGRGLVEVFIRNDGRLAVFTVAVRLDGVWLVSVAAAANDFSVEVEYTQRPDRDEDAAVVFTLAPDDEVEVRLV